MKIIIIAALLVASAIASDEPDWGKIIDEQSKFQNPHHLPPHHDHPSPVPEPATMLLVGASIIGLSMWRKSRKSE